MCGGGLGAVTTPKTRSVMSERSSLVRVISSNQMQKVSQSSGMSCSRTPYMWPT
ncbi:hypothetical protein SAMN04488548_1343976 [Gordonia westfalica]|uniref:Uncharacterized protein n=1 Tax=Gordonia westfalica TaxID=158898 RepID=A0A1H2KXJ5_9ACTN|nr:hypothetical protein SAMN04488548_1343976 [Gordonia westfalica]